MQPVRRNKQLGTGALNYPLKLHKEVVWFCFREKVIIMIYLNFIEVCTVAQKCHGNFNFTTAISTSFTAISISSRQFQFHHGNFNFVHGNFNFITAISISPRQFQLRSRQFQFHHGNFNFTTAISTSFTAISISSRQFQLHSRQFQFRHGNFNFIFSRLTFPFPYLVLRVFLAI